MYFNDQCRIEKLEDKKMAQEFLVMKGISKKFSGIQALNNVDIAINEGEIHCLVGQNGCGKSTLIKIISGVIKPEKGANIWILGNPVHHLTSTSAIQQGILVIYQDLSIFPNLTVAENIAMPKMLESNSELVNWRKVRDLAAEVTAKIGVSLPLEKNAGLLSIADRQLIAICRAIAGDARLLIMDEPTASLTREEVDQLFVVIKELQRKGMTTLFVSHKLNEIMSIAERVTVIRDGKKVGTYQSKELDNEKLIYLMTGKNIAYSRPQDTIKPQCILEVKNLSKKGNYKDISFCLHEGEILGITGLLGSGRTELALSIFGMNPPEKGDIFVNGALVKIHNNRDAIKNGLGMVPEDRMGQGLIMNHSVEANIVVTVMKTLLSRIKLIHLRKRKKLALKLVADLNIKIPDIDAPAKTLSGGNQQRVAVAKWIATDPQILILDGPTIGVDVHAKSGIYEMIKSLAAAGMGIIIISDEFNEVYYNCHRILVMDHGRLLQELNPQEIKAEDVNDFNILTQYTAN
jgi:simple sugar transport system ATP-binding protein